MKTHHCLDLLEVLERDLGYFLTTTVRSSKFLLMCVYIVYTNIHSLLTDCKMIGILVEEFAHKSLKKM